MNRNPVWKNVLVLVAALGGLLLALPNLYGEDPAVQVTLENGQPVERGVAVRVEEALQREGIAFRSAFIDDGRLLVRFDGVEQQLEAADMLRRELGNDFVVALTLAPRTPAWLRALGLKPMSLGLDLRGGVHFLYEVDMDAAIEQVLERMETDFATLLREERIRRRVQRVGDGLRIELASAADLERAEELIRDGDPELDVSREAGGGEYALFVRLTEEQIRQRQDFAIEQNTTTLRNRVDELGVAEPVVQRQGRDRIVVQLPGVQDPAQAERVLGATATLDFRLVDEENDPYEAERRGRAPLGSELYKTRDGAPVLLKREIIVTGDQLTDASSGFSEGSPAVFVRLDAKGASRMLDTTRENLNKGMGVVFREDKRELVEKDGVLVEVPRTVEEVISVATIRGVFSSSFQITGLDVVEARDLALLLRAGSLAAPIYKVEERTIGPSLGQDNIDRGFRAVSIGFLLVIIFTSIYYRAFGVIAAIALTMNLVFLIALMSLLQAALTLPGIAGIVLTVGMAVDANVLIFERIREELRNGNSPQASISAGYDKAFSSIADANITTLIAAVVLFAFGTGPIKGFAVTLSLGIMTSMFSAIVGTRTVVNLIFGARRLSSLPI
ncbi:MAG TPA: protein translocase subunit SecD [Gammaproteobacteria bacterium]|nr:protein translocase subunit SecD [Gammaproteobacteria bacterium]